MSERPRRGGSELLRDFFAPPPQRMSQKQLADALGISQQAVSMWVHGKARPSSEHWRAIERLTGIPVDSWIDEAEQRDAEKRAEKGAA